MKNELTSNFVHNDDALLGTVIHTPFRCTHTFFMGAFYDATSLPGLPEAGGKPWRIVVSCSCWNFLNILMHYIQSVPH